ncbi:ferrochelatase [Chitinophaga qingshengii]|uniref:Ferrochelatase n=1 Tax=Chitinophaga qingshengii TaxID=1569794 RepID=A0ABR7TPL3_9BACT|nr:ferrochelatase [Chitinophaga qingshengii]MBC9932419.1 ferrochelatase [Chitinophaga qingshengii]
MVSKSEVGIILMNLGSPDSTAVPDVKRYLLEFLMDKRVIDYPWLFRKILIEGIIVPRRAEKSAEAYASIWWEDGSPLVVLTKQLQAAVQHDMDVPVEIAMRYGNPHPQVAFDNLLKKNPQLKEVIVLPLYPHYAMSSYETAAEYAKEIYKKKKYKFRLSIIPPFYDETAYIDAVAESMRPFLQQQHDYVLFSYHGVPERHIRKGDITGQHCMKVTDCCHVKSPAHGYCYRHQVTITAELVAAKLGLPREKWGISFQSRLGREEWLKPYTAGLLETLPKEGKKKLLVVCPAFVSDCLETLEEIAVEGKHTFLSNGGDSFTMIPCLNVHPMWVKAIVQYCQQIMQTETV